MAKTTHVVHNRKGGWDVKSGGGARAIKHFETKQPAVDYGRGISQRKESEFLICGMNGRIQVKNSHGNDPFPPKG